MTPPRFGDRRRARVGLLGGSFNPAHRGHAAVAAAALRHLRLDQVWLLVSPGNPLKPRARMADLASRLASARAIAPPGRRVLAVDLERVLGTRYTADTIRKLRARFPRVRFVWIIGADNLAQLPGWHRWRDILRRVPFAVLPRPAYTRVALASRAAAVMRGGRVRAGASSWLPEAVPPAWVFLPVAEDAVSATAIRLEGARASPGK